MTMLHSEAVTELPVTCASVTIPAQGWAEWDTQHVLLHPMYKDEMATKVLPCIELFRGTWKLLGEGFQQSYAWMGHWGRVEICSCYCSPLFRENKGWLWEN